jgi:hypothetical protein
MVIFKRVEENMEQPNLRPLTVSEILDKAFRLYRAKFFPLVGIVALMLIPQGILRLIATYYLNDMRILDGILNAIFQNLAMLALIVAFSKENLQKEFTIKSAYAEGVNWFWSVIESNLLLGLAIALPLVVAGLALVVPVGYIVGLVLFLPLVIFLSTRWSLNSPVIVLEKVGAVKGLERSWEVTKDAFWRVLGTSFFASLLSLLLTVLPYFLVNAILKMLGYSSQTIELVSIVVEQISLVIALPFVVGVKVLIYYDLRIRKEGFDLMLRANEMQ